MDLWPEQVPALADKARLLLIDLPGPGQSGKRNTVYSMDFFAAAALAVVYDAWVEKPCSSAMLRKFSLIAR